jgi:hypothetical protein
MAAGVSAKLWDMSDIVGLTGLFNAPEILNGAMVWDA